MPGADLRPRPLRSRGTGDGRRRRGAGELEPDARGAGPLRRRRRVRAGRPELPPLPLVQGPRGGVRPGPEPFGGPRRLRAERRAVPVGRAERGRDRRHVAGLRLVSDRLRLQRRERHARQGRGRAEGHARRGHRRDRLACRHSEDAQALLVARRAVRVPLLLHPPLQQHRLRVLHQHLLLGHGARGRASCRRQRHVPALPVLGPRHPAVRRRGRLRGPPDAFPHDQRRPGDPLLRHDLHGPPDGLHAAPGQRVHGLRRRPVARLRPGGPAGAAGHRVRHRHVAAERGPGGGPDDRRRPHGEGRQRQLPKRHPPLPPLRRSQHLHLRGDIQREPRYEGSPRPAFGRG
mmetsp:Transcript_3586/g.9647  ORF Transcript_3586/g.9647 Transcript_3586/m.9647 type:complete len:346 (-) Transcript_3586:224-1261(-)